MPSDTAAGINTKPQIKMRTEAFITVSYDISGEPIPYRTEDGKPVTYATREEAQASVDEDVEEYRLQVEAGEREEDDVPEADDILHGMLNEDGSFNADDGTYIGLVELHPTPKVFIFVDGSGRGVRTKMDAAHMRKHFTPDEDDKEQLAEVENFLTNGAVGDEYDADVADHFTRIA
jgi:hypothetical protein